MKFLNMVYGNIKFNYFGNEFDIYVKKKKKLNCIYLLKD